MTDLTVLRERALARLAVDNWDDAPLEECHFGDTDKGHHGYLPLYERHLVREDISTLLEIGVFNGGSLRMWARWLPKAQIVGIDIEPANYAGPGEATNITFLAGDATAVGEWRVWSGTPDVVIDDGSHHGDEQVATFRNFWPSLTSGGWYVIEDLSTVWGWQFRAGKQIWSLIKDELAAALNKGEASELHAYNEILFLRKR